MPEPPPGDMGPSLLTTVRLPVDWNELGFPETFVTGGVTIASGSRGWSWSGGAPEIEVPVIRPLTGLAAPNWGIDHVVLLVPDLDPAVDSIAAAGHSVRRRVEIRGRRTAFFVVGTLLEVVEEASVDRPLLWGIALESATPLADLADAWRAGGHHVTGPRPAFQHGREIITLPDAGAGVAVMSPRIAENRTA